ncbi:MAG: DUF58 domain-containing protein [Planctomycetaceae bacterium]|nr:DUF58 domain-containing protein [Planctomycetaceae bacterium]
MQRQPTSTPALDGQSAALVERAAALRARVRQMELRTRRLASDALAGAYRSNFKGSGIEFDEVRPYLPGDDVRAIDWNVTARTGEPHVKRFAEDRQLNLHLVLDASASMDFGTRVLTKREAAAELVGLVAATAAKQRDPVALELFGRCSTSADLGHVAPGQGGPHVLRLLQAALEAREPRRDAPADGFQRTLEELVRLLRRRSLVFLISDFDHLHDPGGAGADGTSAAWREPLERLGARHDLVLVRVLDPFEVELPDAGILVLRDPESGELRELDTSSRAVRVAWKERARARTEALVQAANGARAQVLEIDAAKPVHDPLLQLFQRRAAMRGGLR